MDGGITLTNRLAPTRSPNGRLGDVRLWSATFEEFFDGQCIDLSIIKPQYLQTIRTLQDQRCMAGVENWERSLR